MITIIYFFFLLLNAEPKEICLNEPIVLTAVINADSTNVEQSLLYEKEFLLFKKKSGKISTEEYDSESKKAVSKSENYVVRDNDCWKNQVSVEVYNDAGKIWQPYPEKVNLMDFMHDSTLLKIEKNGYYYVDFGIDPETVEKIKPGRQKIRVRLLAHNMEGDRIDTAYSEPIEIEIVQDRKSLKDPEFLKTLSMYYLRRGLTEKALEYAMLYDQTNENAYEGAIMLGDVYDEMGDYDKALDYYLSAKGISDGMPHQYEEYLGTKIQGILSKSPGSINKLITTGKE